MIGAVCEDLLGEVRTVQLHAPPQARDRGAKANYIGSPFASLLLLGGLGIPAENFCRSA